MASPPLRQGSFGQYQPHRSSPLKGYQETPNRASAGKEERRGSAPATLHGSHLAATPGSRSGLRATSSDPYARQAESVDYEDNHTPWWAYVICVVTFPVLLCFAFFFLMIKRKRRRRRDDTGDHDLGEAGTPGNHHRHGDNSRENNNNDNNNNNRVSNDNSSNKRVSQLAPLEPRRGSESSMASTPPRPGPLTLPPLQPSSPVPPSPVGPGGDSGTVTIRPRNQGSPRVLPALGTHVAAKRTDKVMMGNRVVLDPAPPALERSLRAPEIPAGAQQHFVNIKFANRTGGDLVLFRITSSGRRERLGVVRAESGVEMNTPPLQPFVVTSPDSEDAVAVFVSDDDDCVALIRL